MTDDPNVPQPGNPPDPTPGSQPGDLPHNVRRVSSRDRRTKITRSADPLDALPPLSSVPPPADAPDAADLPIPLPEAPRADLPADTVSADDAPADKAAALIDERDAGLLPDEPAALTDELPAVDLAADDAAALIDELDSGLMLAVPAGAVTDHPPATDLSAADRLAADDAAALIDELDSGLTAAAVVDDETPASTHDGSSSDDHARYRPPVDRYPPLPHETAELEAARVPLKPAPAVPGRKKSSQAADPAASREDRARAYADQRAQTDADLPPAQERGRSFSMQNVLALLFLVGAVIALGFIITVWNNPFSVINPLPPLTPMPIIVTATYTPTPTPTPSPVPTATLTLTPSPTLTPSLTPTPTAEGALPGADAGDFRFAVDNNRTLYLTNPDSRGGCAWSSIAGSVTDRAGQPVSGFAVRITGQDVDVTLTTGSSPGFGPGGFEHPLGREALERAFTIQLIDPAGSAASAAYPFRTSSLCEWNIAAIRFIETIP